MLTQDQATPHHTTPPTKNHPEVTRQNLNIKITDIAQTTRAEKERAFARVVCVFWLHIVQAILGGYVNR